MRPMNSAEPARTERLERQVAYLLRHLGIDPELAASELAGFGSSFGPAADIFGEPPAAAQSFAAEPQPFAPSRSAALPAPRRPSRPTRRT